MDNTQAMEHCKNLFQKISFKCIRDLKRASNIKK